MNLKNILSILQKAFDRPEYDLESVITNDEKVFSSHLENLIKDSIDSIFFMVTYESLQFKNSIQDTDPCVIEGDDDNNYDLIDFEQTSNDESFDNSLSQDKGIEDNYKQKAVEYWKSGKKRLLKLETVQSKFKRVKSNRQLYRWEQQIINGGNRIEKLKEISEYVLNKFIEAVENSVTVHDLNIRR